MIKTFEKLNATQKETLKKGVIEVSGKAMNRTALGVVDAVFQLYPNITFNELLEILPSKINPAAPKNFKSIFKPFTELDYGVIQPVSIIEKVNNGGFDISQTHFVLPEERFKTSDGVEILVSKMWESSDSVTGENDLQNLINHVGNYGIKVVKVETNKSFNKGTYNIEVINPLLYKTITERPTKPKSLNKIILFFILFLLLAFGIFYFSTTDKDQKINKSIDGNVEEIIKEQEIEINEIEKLKEDVKAGINTKNRTFTLHDILFEYNSENILEESKIYINEVLDLLNEIETLKLTIVGHTSDEGTDDYNLILSEKRADSILNFLINEGISRDRLTAKGQGKKNPIASNDNEDGKKKNRRIEFIVNEDGN